jgi:hypothetical protein
MTVRPVQRFTATQGAPELSAKRAHGPTEAVASGPQLTTS